MNSLITERIDFYLHALYKREHEEKFNASMVEIGYGYRYQLNKPYIEAEKGKVSFGYASNVSYRDIWNVENWHDWEDMPLLGRVRYAQNPIADYWHFTCENEFVREKPTLREHIQNITGLKGLPETLTEQQLWKIGMKNS